MKEIESYIITKSIYSSGRIIKRDEESKVIEVIRMDDAPTVTVSVDKSITKNLGNFNSLKVSAFVSVPCYLNDDEIDRAFQYAGKRATSAAAFLLNEELQSLEG